TPVTFAVASTLRWAFPTTRNPVGFLPDAIQGLRCRLRVLAPHPSGRQLDGFVNLDVAGAAAEIARQCLLDVVSCRTRVGGEQRFGGEEERRGTVAALCGTQLREGLLEGMEPHALCHDFDCFDSPAVEGVAAQQAGQLVRDVL